MFDTVMAFEASIISRNCNYWNFRNTKATDTQTKQRSIENFRKKTWLKWETDAFWRSQKVFSLSLETLEHFQSSHVRIAIGEKNQTFR